MENLINLFSKTFDSHFDNTTLKYDMKSIPLQSWLVKKIQNYGLCVISSEDLKNLHTFVKPIEIDTLQKYLVKSTGELEFQQMVNK